MALRAAERFHHRRQEPASDARTARVDGDEDIVHHPVRIQ